MVSDFIDEHNGYLRLTEEEFSAHKKDHPRLRRQSHEFLEYGKEHEGYWTAEKFLKQLESASIIANIKYPRDKGFRICFVFDHSSYHGTFAEDALDASKMNMEPGGKQPQIHDAYWKGRLQLLVFPDGTPKGTKRVLMERGIDTSGMKLEDMRNELASHLDFREEQPEITNFLRRKGHACIFLPKFHCELNPIEKCWAQAKRYTCAHTNYTIQRHRIIVPDGLDSVNLDNIRKYFRKARNYMFAYLEGIAGGNLLEDKIKNYKNYYKSHRRSIMED